MNDLLSKLDHSGGKVRDSGDLMRDPSVDVESGYMELEMTPANLEKTLERFYEDVSKVQQNLDRLKQLLQKLEDANEESKSIHKAQAMKALRDRMDQDVAEVAKVAKLTKAKLVEMDRENVATRRFRGCEEGSPIDRRRTTLTNSLKVKLKDIMGSFGVLRERITGEYRDIVGRRYFTVTGQKADENVIETIIETGESENFLQKAIQEQGRGKILDIIHEIQERHDAVKEIEKNLLQLQNIFIDMAVLVEAQGDQLNDIQQNMERVHSYTRNAATQLHGAKRKQRSKRKWTLCAIILLLIILLIVILIILKLTSVI